jgi:hypothetical protein
MPEEIVASKVAAKIDNVLLLLVQFPKRIPTKPKEEIQKVEAIYIYLASRLSLVVLYLP